MNLRTPAWWLPLAILACFHAAPCSPRSADTTAIVPTLSIEPAVGSDDDPGVDLIDQEITITLMQNAAFVRLDYLVANPLDDSVDFILTLPRTGYVVQQDGDTTGIATELLDAVILPEDGTIAPETPDTGPADDAVLPVTLGPRASGKVRALFWIPTLLLAPPGDSAGIAPGDRGLTIILDEGTGDRDVAENSSVTIAFTDGLSPVDSLLSLQPLPDGQMDSTLTWDWKESDDAPAEVIVVRYRTLPDPRTDFDTMAKISAHARCCALPDLLEPGSDDD